MADPVEGRSLAGFEDRASLLRALRRALDAALPELRIVAEGYLAEISPIDLLAVGAEGELIAIRVAAPGADPETLTRVLADLSWLRPRRLDLLKLAAGLGIDPSTEPRALLVAPDFRRETRAAVDNFPADTVQLWRCLPGRENGPASLRIEPVDPAELPAPFAAPSGTRTGFSQETNRPSSAGIRPPLLAAAPDRSLPLTDPPSPSAFRTGLCEADLRPAPRREGRDWLGPGAGRAGSPGV